MKKSLLKKTIVGRSRRAWFLVAVTVLIALLSGYSIVQAVLGNTSAEIDETKNHANKTQKNVAKTKHGKETSKPTPSASATPAPSVSKAHPSSTADQSEPKPDAVQPMAILYVSIWGSPICNGPYLNNWNIQSSHSITTNKPSDGTPIKWQTEVVMSDGVQRVDKSGTISIPVGQQNIQFQTPPTTSSNAAAGSKLRLRITSPNSVVSNWYTIPEGACGV